MPVSKVAVIRDYKNDWAFEDGRFAMDFRYMREVYKYYRTLRNSSITTDIISSEDNFDKYKLIVVPSMVLINDDVATRLRTAANNGATIVITCMTGLRNDDVKSFGRILDATVEELAGIEMEEQHALIGTETTKLKIANDTATYTCGLWHDVFKLKTATTHGNYDSRFFKGEPVLSKNQVGKGTVYYVGSVVDEFVASNIVKQALKTADISSVATSTNELVEVTEVAGKSGNYLYAINYSDKDQTIRLDKPTVDILTQEKFGNSAIIKARDFRVLNIK
jgi:beta-galactosidase